jgi:hypothetical protein
MSLLQFLVRVVICSHYCNIDLNIFSIPKGYIFIIRFFESYKQQNKLTRINKYLLFNLQ